MLRDKWLAGIGLIGIVCAIAGCQPQTQTPSPTVQATPNPEETIVLGDISDKPIKKIERFQPLVNYLAANLERFGIKTGQVKIVSNFEQMSQALESGEIDLYFDSLYPAMIISEESGAMPILRRWKDGKAEYNTVFIVRADKDIDAIVELQGKIVGFEEAVSTSGYLLPKTYLLQAGLNPVEKNSTADTIAADEVGYVFTGDHENTVQWVLIGKIVAGAVDNLTLQELPPESRAKLKILAETEKVPRHLVLIAKDLKPEQQEAVKTLLIKLDTTEEGQEILKQFEDTKKFDEFPSAASLEKMQQLYQQVREQ